MRCVHGAAVVPVRLEDVPRHLPCCLQHAWDACMCIDMLACWPRRALQHAWYACMCIDLVCPIEHCGLQSSVRLAVQHACDLEGMHACAGMWRPSRPTRPSLQLERRQRCSSPRAAARRCAGICTFCCRSARICMTWTPSGRRTLECRCTDDSPRARSVHWGCARGMLGALSALFIFKRCRSAAVQAGCMSWEDALIACVVHVGVTTGQGPVAVVECSMDGCGHRCCWHCKCCEIARTTHLLHGLEASGGHGGVVDASIVTQFVYLVHTRRVAYVKIISRLFAKAPAGVSEHTALVAVQPCLAPPGRCSSAARRRWCCEKCSERVSPDWLRSASVTDMPH